MTKLSEFDEATRSSNLRYIDELWDFYRDMRSQSLNRISGYIFVLNSGALLASLTYIATKNANGCIKASIWLFSTGIFTCLAHATIDYYISEFTFSKYTKTVKALFQDETEWEDYINHISHENHVLDILLHCLGWTGALTFVIGLIIGILQIPSVTA